MLRSWPLFAALTLLPACNCGNDDEAPATDPTAAPPADPGVARDRTVLDAVEVLGDEGALVVVLRPGHWASLHEVLSPLLARLPSEAEPLRQAKAGKDLPGLLAFPLGLPQGSVTLAGWDPSRPVVASLGEVPYDGVPGTVTPALPVADGWVPPIRHQVLVPATDSAALIGSLAGLLEPGGKAQPELVAGREGARAVRIDDMSIALLPMDAAVRVVIFDSGFMRDETKRLAAMRERLDAASQAPVSTPALSVLAQPDAVVAGWVRPWRLRPLGAWSGSTQLLQALASVSTDKQAQLMARGTEMVLASELLMTDEGAEFDDLAMTLVVDEGVVRLRGAMSLTSEGEAIFDAAGKGAGEVFAAAPGDALVDIAIRADVRAMLDATEPPPAFEGAKRLGAIAEAIQEGGYFASLYVGIRHPFGVLRTLEGVATKERLPLPIDTLPNAAHLLWRGHNEQVPKLALAVHWPKDYVDAPLAAMVSQAKSDDFESLRFDSTKHEGMPVTFFGLGGESANSFDAEHELPGDAFVQVRISPQKLMTEFTQADPKLVALLAGTSDLLMTWEHDGRALVTEWAWSPTGAEVKAKAVAVDQGSSRKSPIGSPVGGKGAKCLADAGRAMVGGLSAMARASEDHLEHMIIKAMADSEASFACAAEDEATAEAAATLRAMTVRLLADGLVETHQDAAAMRILEQDCKRFESAEICARHRTLAALPQPSLATVEWSSECSTPYGVGSELDVRMDAKVTSIAGELVASADVGTRLKAAIDAAELAARSTGFDTIEVPEAEDGSESGRKITVGLTIDETVDMARVRPILRALASEKITRLAIPVRADDRSQTIAIRLMAEPSIPGAAPTPTPTSPSLGAGRFGIKGPSEEEDAAIAKALGSGILGALDVAVGDWALLEVGKGTVTSRSAVQSEAQEHAAPSASAVRDATHGALTVYVHGADDVPWKEVAQVIAVSCDRAVLVLDVPRP